MKRNRALFAVPLCFALVAQQQEEPVFRSSTRLVVVDVLVKDKSGKEITNLTKEDFVVIEDGKPQQISIFELQKLESAPVPMAPVATSPGAKPAVAQAQAKTITSASPGKITYRDKRLMVLFFDMSSMQVPEQIRAQKAAEKFVKEQMTPADMVAILTFASKLRVDQDFTADRDQLLAMIGQLRVGDAADLAGEASTADENGEDTGAAFEADESEFNIFNTDRKLGALESAAKMLGALPEKKALVYFSSGVGKTGMENQSQLRSTVNAAVRANISFYPVDARGLVAMAPGGDASKAAPRGTGLFSGQSQRQQRDKHADQQETLETLAADTGGKAFLDNNDLSVGIQQAQEDVRSYYVIGYYSGNSNPDGKFRRVQVRLANKNLQAKLDYRSGYFAPKDFAKFNSSDKERQLEEALQLGDPVTDLPIALEVNYFRLAKDRYFIPVAVKIPGSEVALAKKGAGGNTELDFIGQVRDSKGRLAATVRDGISVKLNAADAERLESRNFQYDTGFTLTPGEYTLKFLARENQNGKLGTFEAKFTVPDLTAADKMLVSSVVLANQRESLKAAVGGAAPKSKLLARNPLVEGDQKLIPSITRVFRPNQNLYLYAEVYDPALDPNDKRASLSTTVSFYRGRRKVFESAPLRVADASEKRPGVYPVQFEVPLADFKAGKYTCQVSVIDEIGKRFTFPRASVVVLP